MSILSKLGKLVAEEVEDLAVKKAARKAPTKAAKRAAPTRDLAVSRERPAAPAIVSQVSGSRRRATDSVKYDREKLRVQYPDPAEPVLKTDKKKGTTYMGKGDTPETRALSKARKEAQRAVDAGEFTPFFDPAGRYYVDPARYPLAGNTMDLRGARPDSQARHAAIAQNEGAMGRLASAYERGAEHPGARDWYAMGQLHDAFQQEFGPEMGDLMFKYKFANSMAATTGGASPRDNLTMALYGNHMQMRGEPFPPDSNLLPYPVGGRFAGGNLEQFDKLVRSGDGIGLANPKRFNFSGNFLGHRDRSTIDEQMMNIIAPDSPKAPPSAFYGIYEEPTHVLARKYGIEPANFQDVTWAGGKLARDPSWTPAPMISEVNGAIERTARILGVEPEDVVRDGLMRSGMPGYATGGRVSAADCACQH